MFLLRKFAKTHSPKVLKDYFALLEIPPTRATLGEADVRSQRRQTVQIFSNLPVMFVGPLRFTAAHFHEDDQGRKRICKIQTITQGGPLNELVMICMEGSYIYV